MEEFLNRPKFYFTLVGVWPIAKSKWSWLYYLHSVVNTYFMSYLFLASLLMDIYINLDNLDIVTEASFVLMTQLTFLLKFMCFTFRRSKFVELLQVVKNPIYRSYESDQEKYFNNWSKFANMYTKVFFVSALTCGVIFFTVPLLHIDEHSLLPFRGWFPFDIKTSIWKWLLAYIFQIYVITILVTTNIHLDCTPSIFMNIGCAQIQILKDSLEKVVARAEKYFDNNEIGIVERKRRNITKDIGDNYVEMLPKDVDDKVQELLGKYVQHHMAIINLFSHIQQVFSTAMFTQFFAVVVTLCVTGFQLLVMPLTRTKFITAVSYLLNVLFEISIYCWNGDQVIYESSNIVNSCYKTDWYRCSTKVRKTIFIIMERAKYPLQIIAGRFFIVSIDTLTGILRSSYSYFAVLRNVYENGN